MSTTNKGSEILVGIFLFVGLAFLAVTVVIFGSKGEGMAGSYELTVEFPNASGLIKGSDVLLSGTKIGTISSKPTLVEGSFRARLQLKIREDVPIPTGSVFLIQSSGLMGDKFVDVVLQPNFESSPPIAHGSLISGQQMGGGIEELTHKGGTVMDQLNSELARIEVMTGRINEKLLSEENLKNIEATFANLKTTSESLKQTSQNLGAVVQKASGVVDTADGAMKRADAAAAELKGAIEDVRKTAEATTKTVESARTVFKKISDGQGTLGVLVNDRQMADELKALVTNLKRSGVLFYKDKPVPQTPARVPRRNE